MGVHRHMAADLEDQIALIRTIGYGGTGVAALAAGWSAPVLGAALWCLAVPLVLARRARVARFATPRNLSRWPLRGLIAIDGHLVRTIHLAEGFLTPAVLAAAGVWGLLELAAIAMLAIGATARAGAGFGARVIGCALVGLGLGTWAGSFASSGLPVEPSPDWLGAYGCALVAGYALVLAEVAFRQTGRRVGERRAAVAVAAHLGRYVPEPVLGRSDRTPGSVAREWLTVAFVDLVGFTRLTERLAAEELKPLLDEFLDVAARTALGHGGFVAKVAGDGAMLVFGGADRTRAAKAALVCCRDLRRGLAIAALRLNRLGLPAGLAARFGVASGFCSVGDWGAGERLEFTVIGRPANLASRLQALAAPGESLVCERTALLIEACAEERRSAELAGLGEVSYWPVHDNGAGFTASRP
jgi:class 3 adenylate cyclase